MTEESKPKTETEQAAPAEGAEAPGEKTAPAKKAGGNDRKRPQRDNKRRNNQGSDAGSEFEERVVAVNRVAKVVKGGRRFSFSALMVVGDKKGRVGFGLGKAKEVPEAIRKATQTAQKNLVKVPLDKGTIPHEIIGHHDAGYIYFKPAGDGTGVKAAGTCRAILELAGITNVLTKSVRGNNPHNIVKATFKALKNLRSADEIAAIRGKEVKGLRIK